MKQVLSIEVKSKNRIEWKNAENQPHRLNGPAFVNWYSNGQKWWEYWCQHGV